MALLSLSAVLPPPTLPNPYTLMAWLPPEMAEQYAIMRYLCVVVLCVWSCDWLSSIPSEILCIRESRATVPTAVYIVSRLGTMSFLILNALFSAIQIQSCQSFQFAIYWAFVFAIPPTTLLFFLRLRAIFLGKHSVIIPFALAWLAVLATAIAATFGEGAAHIGTTDYCISITVSKFSTFTSLVTNTMYSTLVFVAISWQLLATGRGTHQRSFVLDFLSGRAASRLTSAVLREGQLYYLVTLPLNLIILLERTGMTELIPAVIEDFMTIPAVALENAMACKVFLHLRSVARGQSTPLRDIARPEAIQLGLTDRRLDQSAMLRHNQDSEAPAPAISSLTTASVGYVELP